jgi:hypothetical protein
MHRFSHFISNEAWRPNCEPTQGVVGSEAARHHRAELVIDGGMTGGARLRWSDREQ